MNRKFFAETKFFRIILVRHHKNSAVNTTQRAAFLVLNTTEEEEGLRGWSAPASPAFTSSISAADSSQIDHVLLQIIHCRCFKARCWVEELPWQLGSPPREAPLGLQCAGSGGTWSTATVVKGSREKKIINKFWTSKLRTLFRPLKTDIFGVSKFHQWRYHLHLSYLLCD